jgi:hypothetical protein
VTMRLPIWLASYRENRCRGRRLATSEGHSRLGERAFYVATKERLAAMAASLCAVCSGAMIVRHVAPDAHDGSLELRTYVCAECGHRQTYGVESGDG